MKRIQRIGLAATLTMAVGPLAVQASQPDICDGDEILTSMKGKIFTNAVAPGFSLGTVHMKLGEKRKMKCGISGQGGLGSGSLNFIHTLVCDDQLEAPTGDIIHSQIQLNTSGTGNFQTCTNNFPAGAVTGTFTEQSHPFPDSGRGVFAGVERGEINIEGEINCFLSLDMKFHGNICLKKSAIAPFLGKESRF